MSRRGVFAAAVALACVVHAAPRLWLADRQGLWADELFSLAMATGHGLEHPAALADPARGDFVEWPGPRPAGDWARLLADEGAGPLDVLRAVRGSDTSPPLYPLLLGAWIRALGSSDRALRALSIACALLALVPLCALARRLGGRRAVVPAVLLHALSPLALHYDTEVRMYSLLGLEALTCLWLTLAVRRPTAGRCLAWAAVSAAGLLTHYFFLFPWLAASGWLLLRPGRLGRGQVVALAASCGLAVLPWWVHVPADLGAWRVTAGWLEHRPPGWSAATGLAALPWSLVSIQGPWGGRPQWDLLLVMGLTALAAWTGPAGARRLLRGPAGLAIAWAAAAVAGVLLFDRLRGTWCAAHPRYAFAGLPALHLVLAAALAGLAASGARVRSGLLLGLLVGASLIGARRVALAEERCGEPVRELGRAVAARLAEGDVVLVQSIPSGIAGVARELEAAGARGAWLAGWVGQLGRRRPADVAEVVGGARRVHLVELHTVGAAPWPRRWLDAHGVGRDRRRLQHATLETFVPRQGEAFAAGGAP